MNSSRSDCARWISEFDDSQLLHCSADAQKQQVQAVRRNRYSSRRGRRGVYMDDAEPERPQYLDKASTLASMIKPNQSDYATVFLPW